MSKTKTKKSEILSEVFKGVKIRILARNEAKEKSKLSNLENKIHNL